MNGFWEFWLPLLFIGYFILLNLGYLILNLVSLVNLRQYMQYRSELGETPTWLGVEPPITLILPAFNEERIITTSVMSVLQLQYGEFEVMVVNDGSTDRTLACLQQDFQLEPQPQPVRLQLPCKPITGIYRSRRFPNLVVLDKANGGKADAINAAINAARHGLFCVMDGDSILQRDSLLRIVQPFIEDERVIAAGGTVRIANGSEIRGGFMVKAGLPRSWLARFQVVEYLRAFLFGRLGWSPMNALLIISGAFGLFNRQRVIDVGGFRVDTVGEDMELVVRLHHYHRQHRMPYRIVYVPDPLCWTEAPEDIGTLGRQRSRWQRGLSESLFSHWRLPFSRTGGAPGWLAWPFMFLFEWLGPLIELMGYLLLMVGFLFGLVSAEALLAFAVVAIGLGMLLSVNGLLLEAMSFRVYPRRRDMLWLFLVALLENFGYRQLNTLWRLRGMLQWLTRRKKHWGRMKRSGSWLQK
ncbi:glycosyltransferase family 2 protein [Zobellella iuensis]|uniref:Glycosyltransferase family 2 protein n=1 Tax=Zobellella iuensis TaxID=2803811 RepID=A0ABS1QMW2_9GAMM|nr:glycosyltransferase [Zobellella iuensis]MBL1376196.1 glycosyltransferase family 2 protein [Zobellella iuensis]